MAEYLAQNLVEVTLSGGINASQTTVTLESGEGARLASTSGSTHQYPLVIYDTRYVTPHDAHKAGKAEVVLVTSHDGSSDTISAVTRGQEGTSAIAHNTSGVTYKAVAGFTKAMFDALGVTVEEGGVSTVSPATTLDFDDAEFNVTDDGSGQAGIDSISGYFERFPKVATIANAAPYNVSSFACYPIGNYGQTTAINFAKDILMAVPDWEYKGSILRGFKMRKNTAGNNLCARIGIYSNTTLNGNYYPGTKLAEVEFSNDNDASPIIHNSDTGTTDIISSDLPYTFTASGIYWYSLVTTDGVVGLITGLSPISLLVFDGSSGGCRNYLGWAHHSSTVLGPIYGVEHAYTYAALPSSFPSSSPALIYAGGTRTSFPYMTKIYQALS